MGKSVVLAEKPSVARDIARVLHCTQKQDGALEGQRYVVTWALGHLVTLADPEAYDKKYEKWEMETLPMIPPEQKLVVIPQTQKQFRAVKNQLFRKDVDDVIIATDAGREGELVARWILEKSGCKKPIRRLWISSVTDKAIRDGFTALKNGREYDNLYRAAAARAEADWLVGMNGTRALTCKYNAQLSCGRVQTPTLAMIRKREEEIRAFKPREYYGITLEAGGIRFTWKDAKTGSTRTFQKETMEAILGKLGGRGTVRTVSGGSSGANQARGGAGTAAGTGAGVRSGGNTGTTSDSGAGVRSGGNAGTMSGTGAGVRSGGNIGMMSGSGAGVRSGGNAGTMSGTGAGVRSGGNTGMMSGSGAGVRSGGNAGTTSDSGAGVRSGGNAGTMSGSGAGVCSGGNTGTGGAPSSLEITQVTRRKKVVPSPGLYDLTTLQSEASQRFGYSPKETLNIMQRLYENHKVLTYPRTDSRYLTKDVVPTLKERLRAVQFGPYRTCAAAILKEPIRTSSSFVNDAKVSDHHAIIPTEEYVQMEHMTVEERKIYDLVVRRFLSVLSRPCEYEEVVLEGRVAGAVFTARGQIMKEPGWRAVYTAGNLTDPDSLEEENDREEEAWQGKADQSLPDVRQGQRLPIRNASLKTGKTKPPARFTEATLLAAMENPIKYMESRDQKAAKTLGETGGLGTVATRADIIEKLFSSFLMEKKGNEIHLTAKGRQLLDLVPEDLRKPELTAAWEMKLSDISAGKLKQQVFLTEIKQYTGQIVDEIRAGEGTYRHENMTNKICPNCGKHLLAVNGKTSRMLVCQDRECGYREVLARTTNARCPNCHKKMELVLKGKEETFVCACGYKERLSAFQARREKEGAGVRKSDVQNYLKKQEKESKAPINNALAQALAGIQVEPKR